MKKVLLVIAVVSIFLLSAGMVLADSNGPMGPNPDAGDCVPDGSSLDAPNGANADGDMGSGPAPNSGDGISDGSGF